jgi:hypothetical protein
MDVWEKDLPAHLRLDHAPQSPKHHRAVILHVFYIHKKVLITLPFLLRKVNKQLTSFMGDHNRVETITELLLQNIGQESFEPH